MTKQNRHPGGSREMTASMSWQNYDRLRQIADARKVSCAQVLEEALERYFAVEDLKSKAEVTVALDRNWEQLP